MNRNKIVIKGARVHNLKNIDLEIPRGKLVVFTGVSGSGKSSLVFDTIFAEGQRRFVESLSSYARQFLDRVGKADVESIEGICPAVAIEQKTTSKNPRSTVGTTTEIYDYLRLLFARIGKTYCINCGNVVKKDSTDTVIEWLEREKSGTKFYLAFPVHLEEEANFEFELDMLKRKGFFRLWQYGEIFDLNENEKPDPEKQFYVVIDRFKIKPDLREALSDSIETVFKLGEGLLAAINAETNEVKNFSTKFECCGIEYEEPSPQFFSFNNPLGACPVCQGFGRVIGYDEELIIPNPKLSIIDGAIAPWRTQKFSKFNRELIRKAKKKNIPIDVPYEELSELHKKYIWQGFDDFIGINGFFEILEKKTYKMHIRVLLSKYRGYTKCEACKGSRLRREALQVKIAERSIADIVKMTIEEAKSFFDTLEITEFEEKIAGQILAEIRKRLRFLNDVGLGYLTLDRMSSTLSGGESQRINLATSLGSALVGTLYVLDEPSIGLHPRDNDRLINILKSLRDLGNTVIVVEHDPEIMKRADLIYDMGPAAGVHGGEIIAVGNYEEIQKNGKSLTGKYLSGELKIEVPKKRRTHKTEAIKIYGAFENNLKNIDVEIPLGKLVVVTGVSGSGKSSLINDVLYGNAVKFLGGNPPKIGKCKGVENLHLIDAVEMVDQSPIGKSPRSNPISYVKGFDVIRELFANTPLARARGYAPGYFSFNVPGGRCETCKGEGFVKIEMQFLADLYLKCEDCDGTRFRKEIRDVKYKGKNIVEVLDMTIAEALEFFAEVPKAQKYLKALNDVGLGYVKLGQPSNTLSGGESQRVKLAAHLVQQKEKNHTLFLFDEPTTGLHFHDIKNLVRSFDALIETNNSVVIIEHNLEIIKTADYIIDLGPEAGKRGGEIVAVGTPEEIARNPHSVTGRYLKTVL
jgi:excinuclease ABC subunit A